MPPVDKDPHGFPIDEQEGGSYLATVLDDLGVMIPGSILTALQLTVWVVRQDGSTAIVNNRNHQNVLNLNNVTVYDTLQTGDGRPYNLRWKIQPEDTTFVEVLPFERHLFLFEWTWPQGNGKHENVLVVRNLQMVP